jgi:leucyl-tRNA synthetase
LNIIAIQINGKLRGTLEINKQDNKDKIILKAKNIPNVQKFLDNKNVIKEIFIENKIINFIVN